MSPELGQPSLEHPNILSILSMFSFSGCPNRVSVTLRGLVCPELSYPSTPAQALRMLLKVHTAGCGPSLQPLPGGFSSCVLMGIAEVTPLWL